METPELKPQTYYERNKDRIKLNYLAKKGEIIEKQKLSHEEVIKKRKENYQKNKDVLNQKSKDHYKANREECIEKQKKRNELNKDKVNNTAKEYYKNNREKVLEKYQDNKEAVHEKYLEKRDELLKKVQCPKCHRIVSKANFPIHQKTQVCINFVENENQEPEEDDY